MALLVGLLGVGAALGCSQSVLVKTDHWGARLEVAGEDEGPVGRRGVRVKVPPGMAPVPYRLLADDGSVVEAGAWEREVRWIPVIAALLGAGVCAPVCALSCFALANPGLGLGPLWLAAGTLAGFGTVLASPSWWTLPLTFAGTLLGLTPLAALGLAERVPPVVWVGVDDELRRRHERDRREQDRARPRRRRPADPGERERPPRRRPEPASAPVEPGPFTPATLKVPGSPAPAPQAARHAGVEMAF